jgi:hypothetical protein
MKMKMKMKSIKQIKKSLVMATDNYTEQSKHPSIFPQSASYWEGYKNALKWVLGEVEDL